MRRLRLHLHALATAVVLAAVHACAPQPIAATTHAGTARPADCAPGDGADPADAIRAMYAALTVDDAEALGRLFAPDFYAFEVGQRFTGPELVALIKAAHAAGKTFVWNVIAPETHLVCDLAWVTWENRGSISDAAGVKPITWIESAVLRWVDGAWRLAFFHSSRVPPPPPR